MVAKYFFNFAFVLSLSAFQIACGQTQSVSNNNPNSVQSKTEDVNQVDSNSDTKKIEQKKETDYFAHLKPEHKEVLQEWLKTKTFLRPAVEEIDNNMFDEDAYTDKEKFKENFEGNMKFLRETVGKDGYQYYSKGDFNKDGKEDFAVLLADSRKDEDSDSDKFTLAIFNAPFKKGQSPNYYEENLYGITNSYIVFDKIMKKHLFLGKFESDVYCATYFPKGKTYRFEDCM